MTSPQIRKALGRSLGLMLLTFGSYWVLGAKPGLGTWLVLGLACLVLGVGSVWSQKETKR